MKLISKDNNIIHLEFPNMKEITMTMCRPQEFYESPYKNIRNKYFSMFELLKAYTTDDGEFDYFKSWVGFNFPSERYEKFLRLFRAKNDITPYEETVAKLIARLKLVGKYYIIASLDTADSARDHEYAHAWFYLDKNYKKAVTALVESLPPKIFDSMKTTLLGMSYNEYVITDEINAYIATSSKHYLRSRFKLSIPESVSNPFRELLKPLLQTIE